MAPISARSRMVSLETVLFMAGTSFPSAAASEERESVSPSWQGYSARVYTIL